MFADAIENVSGFTKPILFISKGYKSFNIKSHLSISSQIYNIISFLTKSKYNYPYKIIY